MPETLVKIVKKRLPEGCIISHGTLQRRAPSFDGKSKNRTWICIQRGSFYVMIDLDKEKTLSEGARQTYIHSLVSPFEEDLPTIGYRLVRI